MWSCPSIFSCCFDFFFFCVILTFKVCLRSLFPSLSYKDFFFFYIFCLLYTCMFHVQTLHSLRSPMAYATNWTPALCFPCSGSIFTYITSWINNSCCHHHQIPNLSYIKGPVVSSLFCSNGPFTCPYTGTRLFNYCDSLSSDFLFTFLFS